MKSGDRLGQQFAESFDLDIMMPPDIASIDSDLNKLSALTPNPIQTNVPWGMGGPSYDNGLGFNPSASGQGFELQGHSQYVRLRC